MWLDKLRGMKEESGLTTREISACSGLPEPTLEKLFAGTTKDPKLTTIQQLVHFFGYTLDDLDDNPPKEKSADVIDINARLTADQQELLDCFNALTDERKIDLLNYANFLMDREKKEYELRHTGYTAALGGGGMKTALTDEDIAAVKKMIEEDRAKGRK